MKVPLERRDSYEADLAAEAEMWGNAAREFALKIPPDWRFHRNGLRRNILYHGVMVDRFLEQVRPGMQALEAGCGSGWLTLAMAQRGAQATGLDISDEALSVARQYYESIREEVEGSVSYRVVDLNTLELEPNTLDVIAVCGTLHHLPEASRTVAEFHRALKPGGLLWVSDYSGHERLANVLFSAFFMLILPIDPGYREKFGKLLHFGSRSLSRVRASMEGQDASAFEGAGRCQDWLKAIEGSFDVIDRKACPTVTQHFTDILQLPDGSAMAVLRAICALERFLLRLRLLQSTGVVIHARKSDAQE